MIRPQMPRRFFRRNPRPSQGFTVTRGAEFILPCETTPSDAIRARSIAIQGEPTRIGVAISEGETGEVLSVHLTPAKARTFAAAILNIADDADGTPPLTPLPDL